MTRLIIAYCLLRVVIIWSNDINHALAQTQDKKLEKKCEVLEDLKVKDTHILSASIVTNDRDLPDYCRVTGYVKPAIHFEIRLPIENWNEKFYMTGCGGACGSVNSDMDDFYLGMNYGLRRNYAVSTMDGGHWGENWRDGRWAYNNRQAEIDWAYRAVHETAVVSKRVIEAFYDRQPERSYFNGCSTGGRMAVMEALRYPEDFDGIISGAPALDLSSLAIYQTWVLQKNISVDEKDIITHRDLELIKKKVYRECDKVDGLEDGIIAKPNECEPNLETILCNESQSKDCLTKQQLAILDDWYGGPKNAKGKPLYPSGVPYGSEPFWQRSMIGKTTSPSDNTYFELETDYLRYMAFQEDPGPKYHIKDFDFNVDPQRLEYMAKYYDADDPDLEKFRENGGKLLMYHGWADVVIPARGSIEYYKAVKEHIGSLKKTQDFFRLYMIPGMRHCGLPGGLGVTDGGVDFLTALEKWVEEGEQPESLLSTKYNAEDSVEWTRPVCPYPQRAVYQGSGDIHEAEIFECETP